MKLLDIKTIIATIFGGIGLLLASVFMSSFFSSPPSRAEFDSLKTEFLITQKSIDIRLESIDDNQATILNYLLNRKVPHGKFEHQKRGP